MRVELVVGGDDSDPEALADSLVVLGEELADLDVAGIEPAVAGEAPAGAKGVELLAVGALLVKLQRSSRVLREVVEAVREWAGRTEARHVKLTVDGDVLEITGASADDMKRLIDAWVERHGSA